VKIPRRILQPSHRCGARKKTGERCRKIAVPGHRRCIFDGGKSTGPRPKYSNDGTRIEMAVANIGLEKWRDKIRQAIAAGRLAKFPQGRKSNAERARIARDKLLSHPNQAALTQRLREQALALDPPRLPQFDPITPEDKLAVAQALVAAGKPPTPDNVGRELREQGFMTDAERRAELEKVLARLRAIKQRAQPLLSKPIEEPPANDHSPLAHTPPAGWRSPAATVSERQAAAEERRRQEHQRLVEQAEKIKQAGRNRVPWAPGPAKPTDDHAGPHYATPDGRPYGVSRSRRD
jgi:hypothetical protein